MKRQVSDTLPYHISARCNNSDWFSLDLNLVMQVFEKELQKLQTRDGVVIHHFILMNNHYHMIASTPRLNLAHAMCNFHRDLSKKINLLSGKKDHLFGKRYFSCVIEKYFYYLIVLKYIYRNPVRAKACEQVEQYPFTSLNVRSSLWKLSGYDEELSLFKNHGSTLAWLNEPFEKELEPIIKKSLQKRKFKIPYRQQLKAHSLILENLRK